jgi:hypothetical protein
MWHPFDLIPAALEPAARQARPSIPARYSFSEIIVARFSDKSDPTGQWPAVVETSPGVEIRQSKGRIEIRHELLHSCRQVLTGHIEIDPDATVRSWEIENRLYERSAERLIVPVAVERGSRSDGSVVSESVVGERRVTRKIPARGLISLHQAMCSGVGLRDRASHLLADDLTIPRLRDTVHSRAGDLPIARGLTCQTLTPDLGFPIELWSNDAGAVVFVVFGATRVLMLQSIEVLP